MNAGVQLASPVLRAPRARPVQLAPRAHQGPSVLPVPRVMLALPVQLAFRARVLPVRVVVRVGRQN